MIRSLGLEDKTFVVTPGDKSIAIEENTQVNDEDVMNNYDHEKEHDACYKFLKVPVVCFDVVPESYSITSYAEQYESHPSKFVIGKGVDTRRCPPTLTPLLGNPPG